jgi:hypothetical protein
MHTPYHLRLASAIFSGPQLEYLVLLKQSIHERRRKPRIAPA